jgi:hypothetical protein
MPVENSPELINGNSLSCSKSGQISVPVHHSEGQQKRVRLLATASQPMGLMRVSKSPHEGLEESVGYMVSVGSKSAHIMEESHGSTATSPQHGESISRMDPQL